MKLRRHWLLAGLLLALTACSENPTSSSGETYQGSTRPVVVASSAIVADLLNRIAGEEIELRTLVPNAVDTHTYEPAASELRSLTKAALVVLPDKALNPAITQVVRISVGEEGVLDLNAAALTDDDYIYSDPVSRRGRNVHTWTDPLLTRKWVAPLRDALIVLLPDSSERFRVRSSELENDLTELDAATQTLIATIPQADRKLVVYHDAWEYFGRRYGLRVVGALQAVSFAEPSAAEVAAMADQIRREGVPAFFGSEVFPSDVMRALERESGARYVPDLADDQLPGRPGDPDHSYIGMMRYDVDLIVSNLRR